MEDKEDSFEEEWVKWVKNVMKRSKDSDKDEWLKQEEEFIQYIESLPFPREERFSIKK